MGNRLGRRKQKALARMAQQSIQNRQMPGGVVATSTMHTEFIQTAGPIPAPEVLAAYNTAIPGLGERIVATFEAETLHRRELENKTLAANIADMKSVRLQIKMGQVFALAVSVFAFFLSGWIVWVAPTVAGIGGATAVAGGNLTVLVLAFLREKPPQPGRPDKTKADEQSAQ
jgi:uncharacterized membrane protein